MGSGIFSGSQSPTRTFFLYLAFNAPHFPIQPPSEWVEKVKQREPGLNNKRAKNLAFVEHLDFNIGRVLDALQASGLAENTIVAFASDNGGHLDSGANNAISLMPLLKGGRIDAKRELYFIRREGGSYGGKEYHALIYDGWKLMQNTPFAPLELYHLAQDPQEKSNLIAAEKPRRDALLRRMSDHIQIGGATPWQPPALDGGSDKADEPF